MINFNHILFAPDTGAEEAPKVLNDDGTVNLPEESQEEPETDEEPKKDSPAEEGKPEEDKPDEDPTYQGKSREEIIEMHRNASTEITKLNKESMGYKKTLSEHQQTLSDIQKHMTSQDMKEALVDAKKTLYSIDSLIDPDAYKTQTELVAQIEADYSDKKIEEMHNSSEMKGKNEAFAKSYLKTMEESGFKLKAKESDSLRNAADQYLENGHLTERSFRKAMFDILEPEQVDKFYAVQAEQKTRNDIVNATKKVDDTTTVAKGKSAGRKIPAGDLSRVQARQAVRAMSDEELDALLKK